MAKQTVIVIAILLVSVIFLSITDFKTESSILSEAHATAEEIFLGNETTETNYNMENFSFYLPNKFEVIESDESNIILNDGQSTYIVFINQLETSTSQLNYNAAKVEGAHFLKSFSDDEKFGYLRIMANGAKKNYQLQVGVGGVKITTYTTKLKLVEKTEELMKMALSIAVPHH